ncbi:MAG: hypothetical protein WCX46_02845 [Candidatus Paceibacterota bacterium]|jgi:hypothetical protein
MKHFIQKLVNDSTMNLFVIPVLMLGMVYIVMYYIGILARIILT